MRRAFHRVSFASTSVLAARVVARSDPGPCVAEAEEEDEYVLPRLGLRREKPQAALPFDSVIVGCGISGTAAVMAMREHPEARRKRCLVLDSDPRAAASILYLPAYVVVLLGHRRVCANS